MIKKLPLLLIVILMCTGVSMAQSEVEMADVMRSNGKIYVVVAVVGIVLLGLIAYLISIDKQVKRLEEEMKKRG